VIEGPHEDAIAPRAQFKVFISYRRADAAAEARLLYHRLAQPFGAENVFLDVVTLEPGTRWMQAIKDQGQAPGACLAMIGPQWLGILTGRIHGRFEEPGEDVVKLELELALSRDSGVQVIPVLVGGATMPGVEQLPRSLRALSDTHAVELRHAQWDQDVNRLIEALERIAGRAAAPAETQTPEGSPEAVSPQPGPEPSKTTRVFAAGVAGAPRSPMPGPDERHYETVIQYMVDQGTVVSLLGSRVVGMLPDAQEIAADLARSFGTKTTGRDLPRVAEEVYVSAGRPDLVRRLHQILGGEPQLCPVHRFLAQLPGKLKELKLPPRYQMIVTTNYDAALERAFDDENEPYDLAVFMSSGPDRGRFVHFPFDRDPEPISVPNHYGKFPIDDYGELERTVIVKIHGGLTSEAAGYVAKDNFVVTEDQYIDYLSSSPVESLVPVQILAKLTESHCLFLGYSMRDWSLRVFLQRIWKGEPVGAKSWAVLGDPDELEKDFWSHSHVDFFVAPLEQYIAELHGRLLTRGVPA
jgi:hypothetical protein